MVSLVDAVAVLIVAESRKLEELVEAAVVRVNRERAALLREPMYREKMMQQPRREEGRAADQRRMYSEATHCNLIDKIKI